MKNSEDVKSGGGADPATNCTTTSDGPELREPQPPQGPPKLDENKRPRKFEEPVAWLFGRQLIRSVKGMLLYSAFGSKLDPRDWMTARPASFDPNDPTTLVEGLDADVLSTRIENNDGFWFDYISDTGDGMRATYSIAYLCLSDIAVPSRDPAALKAGDPALPIIKDRAAGPAVLPRGEFLFVGGDTAYHASDYMTLITRIYQTFNWAYQDLENDEGIDKNAPPRPIYGIPGNHDYYDQLDGFRRQFHRPVLWESRPPAPASQEKPPYFEDYETAQLRLRGFYRTQASSYVALRLPFRWWLWGLDTETGQIDDRQKKFFRQFCRPERAGGEDMRDDFVVPPDRLIVATCSPTTTFGKLASPQDFKSADAFGQLGIEQPFLPDDLEKSKRPDGTYDLSVTGDERLKSKQCRLDISGDVHHYARYWGPPPPPCSIEPRVGAGGDAPKAERPTSESYASVVSGIGGAFHHPSQTYFDQVREQSLYPSEKLSTGVVSRLIFNFITIWNGGYVQLAGAVIAFLIYFALTVPQSSRQVINNVLPARLGLATCERLNPTVGPAPAETVCAPGATPTPVPMCQDPGCVDPFPHKLTGAGSTWWEPEPVSPCQTGEPRYFFGPCRIPGPWDFWLGLFMALGSVIPLIVALVRKKLYQGEVKETKGHGDETYQQADAPSTPGADAKPSYVAETSDGNKIKPATRDPEFTGEPGKKLWLLFGLAAVLFFLGLSMVEPYRSHITPFGSSLLVLLTLVWAGLCVALNLRYSEFLFKKAHDRPVVSKDWWLTYALNVAAVLAAAFGLWSFGRNTLPALLLSDILFIVALLVLAVGLVWAFPFTVDVGLFPKQGKVGRGVLRALVGLWHFLLQLAVPFVLVRKASLLTLIIVLVVLVVGRYLGEYLFARYNGPALALVWVVLSALTIGLPIWLVDGGDSWLTQLWFVPGEWTGWLGLVPSLAAAVVGAVMCCYWFGWYLGVCFAFNGHNNEVGGAARIERFKQFVRFHLTDEGLTGYVIAVNDPSDTGRELTPHVVDVFHLHPKV